MALNNPTLIKLLDEAIEQGLITELNFTGAGVAAARVGLRGNITIAGGGGASATRTLLAIPFPAKHEILINVVDATVLATSRILAWLSGLAPEVIGSGDGLDLIQISPVAKVGSFDLGLNFETPFAGSLSIDYMVLT